MAKGAWSNNGAVDPVRRQNFVGKLPTWFYKICLLLDRQWKEDKNDEALVLLHLVSLDWEEKTEAARVWNTLRLCSRLPHCLHLQFGMERICKKTVHDWIFTFLIHLLLSRTYSPSLLNIDPNCPIGCSKFSFFQFCNSFCVLAHSCQMVNRYTTTQHNKFEIQRPINKNSPALFSFTL